MITICFIPAIIMAAAAAAKAAAVKAAAALAEKGATAAAEKGAGAVAQKAPATFGSRVMTGLGDVAKGYVKGGPSGAISGGLNSSAFAKQLPATGAAATSTPAVPVASSTTAAAPAGGGFKHELGNYLNDYQNYALHNQPQSGVPSSSGGVPGPQQGSTASAIQAAGLPGGIPPISPWRDNSEGVPSQGSQAKIKDTEGIPSAA
jgi:hypothetical protein